MSAFDTFQVLSSKANQNWADKPWEQQRFLESGNTLLVHQNPFMRTLPWFLLICV